MDEKRNHEEIQLVGWNLRHSAVGMLSLGCCGAFHRGIQHAFGGEGPEFKGWAVMSHHKVAGGQNLRVSEVT